MTEDKTPELPPLISGKQLELLRKAVEIEQIDARTVGMVGYAARLCAQLSMPYRDPGDISLWERRNGSMTLVVKPGIVFDRDGQARPVYPYGVMPRLLLTWMATEVVRLQDRELSLGPSLAAFMKALELPRTGPAIARLRDQIQRLAWAQIIVHDSKREPDYVHEVTEGFQIATRTDLWWTPKDGPNEMLWPSTITLSDEFYKSILAAPIPVDLRVLGALRSQGGGGLPIDIYTWLAHRMSYLRSSTLVPWALLARQFGSQYKQQRQFKAEFLKALPKVLVVYPAKVKPTDDGLLLSPSPTPIPRRGSIW